MKGGRRASKARETARQYQALRDASFMFVGILALAVAVVAGLSVWGERQTVHLPTVKAEGGFVRIPVSGVSDGHAHFYVYEGSRPVRFFVLRGSDGVLRAAFDTCDVCFRSGKGYRHVGDTMVCNQTNQRLPSRLSNQPQEDCNPVPLESAVEQDVLVLRSSDLEKGAQYFSHP